MADRVKRTVRCPESLYEAARRAAAIITARTGRDVSINDLQAWGLHRQVMAVKDGDLERPEGYDHE